MGKKQAAERCEEPKELTQGIWLPPAERYPVAQQWHDIGEMPLRTNKPKIRMGSRRNVSPIPEG
jgi:hypothetical protein